MIHALRALLALAALAVCTHAAAEITFYEFEGYAGRSFTTPGDISYLGNRGFNDRASSIYVVRDRWEVCEGAEFGGRCMILRPGRYPSLAAMGMDNRISSVRMVNPTARIEKYRYAPLPSVPVVVAPAPQIVPQITFYEREGFGGRTFTATQDIGNFERFGFNDRASSVVVTGDRWEVCDDLRFSGRCVVLRPGRYASLAAMGLSNRISSVHLLPTDIRIEAARYAPAPVVVVVPQPPQIPQGRIVFYEGEGFAGRSVTTNGDVGDFARLGLGFDDRASSVIVLGERWEVCEHPDFGGRCRVLRPGRYPSLAAIGLNDRISSVRLITPAARIEDFRYAPAPLAVYDNRRRSNERIFEANVTSVRAVLGPPEQRCWIEREQIGTNLNVPGAVVGAVIGGVLGHQVGGGRGQDLATIGGAVAGGAVGANVGRGDVRDIQRCENVPSQARPDHWDVFYTFRGQDHRIQMTTPPGPTILVNEFGEPRV